MKSPSSRSSNRPAERLSWLARLAQKKNEGLVLLSVAATLLVMAWIVLGLPIGVQDEWIWRSRVVIGARFWTPLGAVALLIAAAGWLTRPNRWEKMPHRRRALWLVAIFLIAWLLAVGVLGIPESPVLVTGGIIASREATSYFSVAIGVEDLPDFLQYYPQLMSTFPQHARTHPPGPIVFFWAVDQALRHWPALDQAVRRAALRVDRVGAEELAPAIRRELGIPVSDTDAYAAVLSAVLLAGIGCLALFPLYQLTAARYDPTTALRALLLFATVPSFLVFAPVIDELVLLFAVLILWSFQLLREKGNPLLGLCFALGLLVSVGLIVMVLFLALWLLLERRLDGARAAAADKSNFLLGLLGAAVLFCAVFLLLQFLLGLNFPAVLEAGLTAHRHTTVEEVGRTYWKWIIYNPVEFAIFLGMPLVIWAAWGIRGAFAWAWIATLLLLNLSGWVRAEAGRIWLFLMPPAAMIAADRLGRLGKRFDLGFFSALVLQIGQAITMKAGLDIFILK